MTYFIDLHVLGQDPKHIRTALSAWRKDAKKSLATGDGDVVGKAAETKPAQAPFPAVGMVGVAGAAFDHNVLADADETIERLAKKAAASLGVQAVVAVWWRLDGESVKFTAINADGQVERGLWEGGKRIRDDQGQYIADPLELRIRADDLFRAVLAGEITAEVHQSLPLAEVAEAHRALESRATTGATVLTIG